METRGGPVINSVVVLTGCSVVGTVQFIVICILEVWLLACKTGSSLDGFNPKPLLVEVAPDDGSWKLGRG